MRRFGLISAVAALSFYAATTGQAALVSLYTFDNASNLGANAVSSAYDGTPASNSGTDLPGAVAGFLGGAVSVNLNNNINIPANCPPAGGTMGTTGTFSVWARGNCSDTAIDYQLGTMAGGGGYVWIDCERGKFGAYLAATNGGTLYWIGQENSWPDTTNWHHVVITWSTYNGAPASGREQVYIDGNAIAMNSTNSPAFNGFANGWSSASKFGNSFSSHQINGDRPTSSTNVCNGMTGAMDDWSLWNTEFTAAQAKALNNLNKDATLKYNAKDADALFNVFTTGVPAVVQGKTWVKYGNGTDFDGTGALTDHTTLALGSAGGVSVVPEPGTLTLSIAAAVGLLAFVCRRRN